MDYCVIQTGGKQYRVGEGDFVRIEKMDDDSSTGKEITFSDVVLCKKGDSVLVGDECAEKKVVGVLEDVGKGKKISVIKFKSKSNYKRQYGHRQPFWNVRITSLG